MQNRWLLPLVAGAYLLAVPAGAQELSGRLVVFNAGSLAAPFRDLLREFERRNPAVDVIQESSGSLEAARKLTELGRIPDVIGVADYHVISSLLVPRHAGWYAGFARTAMVLAYTHRSIGGREITGESWWRILLRPGVRVGRSDPVLDPNGYRTLMVYQLAEAHYRDPGLAARLLEASPRRFVRPKAADLVALLQAGELDYAWSYRSIAETVGLRYVSLPPEVDLSDPARGEWYARARVRVPGTERTGADSVEFRGEPIVYGLTIPRAATNPAAARAFVRFLFSA
ncbi:MAG: tungstate ABC transporter substrate-binding protein WtpA, partial [Gemmatimonadales bacterium]